MSAVIEQIDVDVPWDVEAVLNYAGTSRHNGAADARTVTLHDARRTFGLGLDRSGFELIRHRATLGEWSAFRNTAIVQAIEYPEVAAALRARTRAKKVLVFDHTLRALGEPIRRVHNDHTAAAARERVLRHLSAQEAAWRLQRRFAIVNFWRPIGAQVLQAPLALCDGRTIKPDDLVPSEWPGETSALAYSSRHRWYWYPQQSPAEATLLKVYDSASDGRARLTARTTFEDPTSSPAPAPRSIELRALLFW
jgi:hypothetical protein